MSLTKLHSTFMQAVLGKLLNWTCLCLTPEKYKHMYILITMANFKF
jgi:hypothetical protein